MKLPVGIPESHEAHSWNPSSILDGRILHMTYCFLSFENVDHEGSIRKKECIHYPFHPPLDSLSVEVTLIAFSSSTSHPPSLSELPGWLKGFQTWESRSCQNIMIFKFKC